MNPTLKKSLIFLGVFALVVLAVMLWRRYVNAKAFAAVYPLPEDRAAQAASAQGDAQYLATLFTVLPPSAQGVRYGAQMQDANQVGGNAVPLTVFNRFTPLGNVMPDTQRTPVGP